jgi:hypothetical protein
MSMPSKEQPTCHDRLTRRGVNRRRAADRSPKIGNGSAAGGHDGAVVLCSPFTGMTRSRHRRFVAGAKGGSHPPPRFPLRRAISSMRPVIGVAATKPFRIGAF